MKWLTLIVAVVATLALPVVAAAHNTPYGQTAAQAQYTIRNLWEELSVVICLPPNQAMLDRGWLPGTLTFVSGKKRRWNHFVCVLTSYSGTAYSFVYHVVDPDTVDPYNPTLTLTKLRRL